MTTVDECLTLANGRLASDFALNVQPHNTIPGLTLNSELTNDQYDAVIDLQTVHQCFPYDSTFPVPLLPPKEINFTEMNGFDPAMKLVNDKKKWKLKCNALIKSCRNNSIKIEKKLKSLKINEDVEMNLPINICRLANHLEEDPDEHFSGFTNWYYGNNMEILINDGNYYAVHPKSNVSSSIYLTQFDVKDGFLYPILTETYEITDNTEGPVYQIQIENGNILTRTKKTCKYYKCSTDNEKGVPKNNLSVDQLMEINTKDPLCYSHINPFNRQLLCTLTTNRLITLWDVSQATVISEEKLLAEKLDLNENWGNVHFISENTFLYNDRNDVHLMDTRCQVNKSWTIEDFTDTCEEICTVECGTRDFYHYIATNHRLLAFDIRNTVQQRWTHNLPERPSTLKIFSKRNNQSTETILIANQHSPSVILIDNCWNRDNTKQLSQYHPYTLPTVQETLHKARTYGLCLNYRLTSRFEMSLTGLCSFQDDDNNLFVLQTNSLNDVFYQKISRETNSLIINNKNFSDEEFKAVSTYEKNIEELFGKSTKLRYATKQTSHGLLNYLACKINDDENTPDVEEPLMDREPSNNWKLSKKKLFKYCDMLAPKILGAWNIEDEPEWNCDDGTENMTADVNSTEDEEDDFQEKVLNWMKTMNENSDN